ncbi:3'-5' exonuclease [Aquimarina algicola]|uniref:3'-5' exonuclease n=1 Tax=Aquimarina algicola TaxID=2589995 RepID=A0A504J6W0_9FLAO|nr:3'-5' exonuclease [Aquimarina algicola]TPN82460.1 3'-5' exonuclease [Aquimarina algicola]
MLNWLKHKDYPDFWNEYHKNFNSKTAHTLTTTRFVIFDTETTGLNTQTDRILSIGAIGLTGNVIDITDSFEMYITQDTFNPETVKIHGILKQGHITKVSEKEAIQLFLEYIKDSILVAHHTRFDLTMINNALARLQLPKLKNKTLDTEILFKKTKLCNQHNQRYSLDKLCNIFNIAMHDRHTASGDAYITSLIFLKIIALLKKERKITLKDLFFGQNRRGLL